jgi:hypothetical protein
MKTTAFFLLVASIFAPTSCSKSSVGTQATAPPPTPGAAATNPTTFPLITGAVVVAAKPFSQTIQASQTSTGVFKAGPGTYTGDEVIASSNDSLAQLENWLRQSEKQPPSGYTAVVVPANMATIHTTAQKNGVDFAMFRDSANPNRGLIVVAMDPALTNAKLGAAISLVSKYQMLPEALRNGVDSQLKQRYGYTASEFVEPGSPLGSAVGALSDFKGKNQRAIIILDAAKQ